MTCAELHTSTRIPFRKGHDVGGASERGFRHARALLTDLGFRPRDALDRGARQNLILRGARLQQSGALLLAPDGAGELQGIESTLRDARAIRSTDLLSS